MKPKSKVWLRRASLTLAGLIILALIIRPKIDLGSDQAEVTGEERQTEEGISVDAVVTSSRNFSNSIRATGSLLAEEEIQISPEVAGRITELNIREGEDVEEGELLVKLNDADLQASLRSTGYRIGLAELREERQRRLRESDASAQQDYDEALNELNTLRADREELQAQIEKTEIRAPFDGVIGFKNVSVGSYVSSSTAISSLQQIDPIRVEFSVPERYRSQLHNGQQIRFQVEGQNEWFNGEIYAIQPRVNSDSRTISLRARADNEQGILLPGAFARVEIDLDSTDDAILIPTQALVPEMEGYHVFTYADGSARRVEVETGRRTDTDVLIREGLAPGDTVLTTGLLQLRDDMAVRLGTLQEQDS